MAEVRCKHCGKTVQTGRNHNCPQKGNISVPSRIASDDDNFLLSVGIGAVTDSTIIGGLVGGNFSGGLVGDFLNGGSIFDDV